VEGRCATLALQFFGASALEVFASSRNPDPGLKANKGESMVVPKNKTSKEKNLHCKYCNLIILGCCMAVCYMLLLAVQHAIPSGNQTWFAGELTIDVFFQLDMGFSI